MYDHLIYTDKHLRVLRLLEIPDESLLAPSKALKGGPDIDGSINLVSKLPNSVFPSDHLRLEVEFELIRAPKETSV